jgi:hypothetical protein
MIKMEFKKDELDEDIEHWKCAACGRPLTFIVSSGRLGWSNIRHETFFVISRSNMGFQVHSNGELEPEEENVKMKFELCWNCFDRALGESPTLRKWLQNPDGTVTY